MALPSTDAIHFHCRVSTVMKKTDGSIKIVLEVEQGHGSEISTLLHVDGKASFVCALAEYTEQPGEEVKFPRKWDDLQPSQQAGILCADPEFQRWIVCRCDREGRSSEQSEDFAARYVRECFGVGSRSKLNEWPGPWAECVSQFRSWQKERAAEDEAGV